MLREKGGERGVVDATFGISLSVAVEMEVHVSLGLSLVTSPTTTRLLCSILQSESHYDVELIEWRKKEQAN